jgi:hypothetical protein
MPVPSSLGRTARNRWVTIWPEPTTSCDQRHRALFLTAGTLDFIKKISVIRYTRQDLADCHERVEHFAEANILKPTPNPCASASARTFWPGRG